MPARKPPMDLREKARRLRRRRVLARRLIWLVLGLVLLGELIWFARTDRFWLREIVVSGNQSIPTDQIKQVVTESLTGNYFYLFPKAHFLWYSPQTISVDLQRHFLALQDILIKRDGTNRLLISVVERRGEYLWCQNDGGPDCFLLDRSGFAFAPAPSFSGQPFLEFRDATATTSPLGRWPLSETDFRSLTNLLGQLEPVFNRSALSGTKLRQVILDPAGDFRLVTSGGFALLFNREQTAEAISETLRLALATPELIDELKTASTTNSLEYFDLRTPGKVFYKFSP